MQHLLIIIISFFTFSSAAVAKDEILLTNGEWSPYLSQELPHYGAASHIVTEAFHAMGIETTYRFFPWKRAYILAENGTYSGSLVWVSTPDREKLFLYSDVVIHESEHLFHLKSKDLAWQKIEDLKGLSIGATLHTSYPTLERAAEKGLITLERAGNYDTLFKRLLKNRIDAIPMVSQVAMYYLHQTLTPEEQARITYSETVLQQRKYHLILSKRLKENDNFLSLFNTGLARIHANGRYDEILKALKRGGYE